jgi:uncharacterized protein YuzB (UPF0349 family)
MTGPIEYCLSNVSPAVREELRDSRRNTVEHRCLQRCGRCRNGPFFVVDGALKQGPDHRELLSGVLEGQS